MNLMDTLMDEFQDETKIAQMEEREIMSWLEVNITSESYIYMCSNIFYLLQIQMKHSF
jgi:hypothetical protein